MAPNDPILTERHIFPTLQRAVAVIHHLVRRFRILRVMADRWAIVVLTGTGRKHNVVGLAALKREQTKVRSFPVDAVMTISQTAKRLGWPIIGLIIHAPLVSI